MRSLASVQDVRDRLGLDGPQAVRWVRWMELLHRLGVVRAPALALRVIECRTSRLFPCIFYFARTLERYGCAICGCDAGPADGRMPQGTGFGIWHPPTRHLPAKLRPLHPGIFCCRGCHDLVARHGGWDELARTLAADEAEVATSDPTGPDHLSATPDTEPAT